MTNLTLSIHPTGKRQHYFDKNSGVELCFCSFPFVLMQPAFCRRLNQMIGKSGSFASMLQRTHYEFPRSVY